MTREETKKRFQSWCQGYIGNNASDEDYQMFNNIMALLEQEPCEDAISRQAVMDCFKKWQHTATRLFDFEKELFSLPSVNPQEPKSGHWIAVTNGRGGHECSLCHEYASSYKDGDERLTKYCPSCGAKMVECTGLENRRP